MDATMENKIQTSDGKNLEHQAGKTDEKDTLQCNSRTSKPRMSGSRKLKREPERSRCREPAADPVSGTRAANTGKEF